MSSAVGQSLLFTFIIDFGIQFVFYVPAAIWKTEKFYDISGSLTYMSCILVALLWRQDPLDSISSLSVRQILAAAFVLVWCTRLGTYLFKRILREGTTSILSINL